MINPQLEQLVIQKLSEPKTNSGYTYQDHLKALADEIQNRSYMGRLESQFMQAIEGKKTQDPEFNQSLQGLISKDTLAEGFGIAISGQVGGMFGSLFGGLGLGNLGIGIGGLNSIIAGWALQKYALKTGMGATIAHGIKMGGIGVGVAGFVGSSGLFGMFGGRTTTSNGSNGNVVF